MADPTNPQDYWNTVLQKLNRTEQDALWIHFWRLKLGPPGATVTKDTDVDPETIRAALIAFMGLGLGLTTPDLIRAAIADIMKMSEARKHYLKLSSELGYWLAH